MRKIIHILITSALLLGVKNSFPVSASSTTKAIFAFVDKTGVIPVADQSVLKIPCAPINNNCQEVINYLTNIIGSSGSLSENQVRQLDIKIRQSLIELRNTEELRTNLKGEVEFNCSVVNCLIYTAWVTNDNNIFWLRLQERNTRQEYPPSKGITIASNSTPPEIIKLQESALTLSSRISAGINYLDFPQATAPFIQSVSELQRITNPEKYQAYISSSKTVIDLIKVLNITWDAYIKSTSRSTFRTTHNISCKNADIIKSRWNDIVGYEDINFKGGLLGCLSVDLGQFRTPYGDMSVPEYMLSTISRQLKQISTSSRNSNAIVPSIELPKN